MAVWTAAEFPGYTMLALAAEGNALTQVEFVQSLDKPPHWSAEWIQDDHDPVLVEAVRQLREYFAREREQFDVPLRPTGQRFN
jgi:methylated-DNA-[protein]-cysteine S-methyltransferase